MRVGFPVAVCAAALAVAGCAGASQKPAPSPAPISTATPAADPVSTAVAPLVAPSHADKVVCVHFAKMKPVKPGAAKFMAWLTFGGGREIANQASSVLIRDIVTWYDDAYMSFGKPADMLTAYAAALEDCTSIGVAPPAG